MHISRTQSLLHVERKSKIHVYTYQWKTIVNCRFVRRFVLLCCIGWFVRQISTHAKKRYTSHFTAESWDCMVAVSGTRH